MTMTRSGLCLVQTVTLPANDCSFTWETHTPEGVWFSVTCTRSPNHSGRHEAEDDHDVIAIH